ncbi:hypothetical protein H5410_005230 [Solanum commersonii]|uniref:Uncharacterized protein n=1 Tax=Solanum commersonii TaxID=4109 RepID=A0A9J6A704_SOLCO|nr:hypothetical protein H5410_005230 [Solanum commersonii]
MEECSPCLLDELLTSPNRLLLVKKPGSLDLYYVPTTLVVMAPVSFPPKLLAMPKSDIFGFISMSSKTLLGPKPPSPSLLLKEKLLVASKIVAKSNNVASSLTTRLPESRSCAIGFCTPPLVVLEDQTTLPELFTRVRFPCVVKLSIPFLSFSGVSLLATHTTVCTDTLLNHIPRYRLLDVGVGEKNPNSKFPPDETIVFPSLIGSSLGILSAALDSPSMIGRDY